MTGADRAAALRAAFDSSFALPLGAVSPETEDLLHVRVAGAPYSFRLRELSGLVAKRAIVQVPSRSAGLLGLSGIRGEIVPVFSLAALLGTGTETDAPPWVVLSAAPEPIAFAFSHFDGFVRVQKTELHPAATSDSARPWLTEFVSTADGPRALIGVPLLVGTLHSRLGPSRPKEQ